MGGPRPRRAPRRARGARHPRRRRRPVGFVSDHVELLFDVDIRARAVADELGMRLERPPALNDDPVFIEALAELVRERRAAARESCGVKAQSSAAGSPGSRPRTGSRTCSPTADDRPRRARAERLGGKIVTERTPDGFVVEGAPDSFLSRKERGVGPLRGARARTSSSAAGPSTRARFVRLGSELHPLPGGPHGDDPDEPRRARRDRAPLGARESTPCGRGRDPAGAGGRGRVDRVFVSRRLGGEAYERLVEPLMTGIYGGDGEQLSLQATFPQPAHARARARERASGSARAAGSGERRSAVRLARAPGWRRSCGSSSACSRADASAASGSGAIARSARRRRGFVVELDDRATVEADAVVAGGPRLRCRCAPRRDRPEARGGARGHPIRVVRDRDARVRRRGR